MKINFKSENIDNTRKFVKSLWNANVKPKPLDVDKYVTMSSSLTGETRDYISGFKSIIANYAKANDVKIKIAGFTQKFHMNIFMVKASNETTSAFRSVVVSPPYGKTHEKFASKIFESVEFAVNKLKNSN